MMIKFRYTTSAGKRSWSYGDVLRFYGSDKNTMEFSVKTLHHFVMVPLKDLIAICANDGLYSEPNRRLLSEYLWKYIPKSKIMATQNGVYHAKLGGLG